jgi:formamidase
VAQPPNPQNVHAGKADDTLKEKVGKEGARTIPGKIIRKACLVELTK